jgi:23S rRNA pseudouridine1911/1915/1917 synthase
MEDQNVSIVYEDECLLVVDKPAGLKTVPLKSDGEDVDTLFGRVKKLYPECGSFSGYNSWESGVLHRLDTPTSGLVVIARNKECFDTMLYSQKAGLFWKEYIATSHAHKGKILPEGFPPYELSDPQEASGIPVMIGSLFRMYGKGRKMVAPVTESCSQFIQKKATGSWYVTEVSYIGDGRYRCHLSSGFRHQVRAHLAWSGHPLDGDDLYGGEASSQLGLRAIKVRFQHPYTQEMMEITAPPFYLEPQILNFQTRA